MAAKHPPETTVADLLGPVFATVTGERPVALHFWDGSRLGPADPAATVTLRSPDALRRIIAAPGELGLARAYVAGDLELDGDIFAALGGEVSHLRLSRGDMVAAWRSARTLGLIGRPPPPPAEEMRLRGRLHSRERDAAAVAHHYNVGNDFYRLLLGETMAYSCAFWANPGMDLGAAQEAKFELVCQKLGLRPGMRLLDIGCGWGGMAMHAARHHGVRVVGITIASEQAHLAARRVAAAGMEGAVTIRLQDYRDVADGPFDAVSSIGMFEHVGVEQQRAYFKGIHGLLVPEGRLLNHAISSPDSSGGKVGARSFMGRYVFPDGELHEVGHTVTAMQDLGLEVRDVESLREHYARTLRAWVANLEASWDAAVRLAGPGRARVWRLYLAASAVNFEAGRTSIHQVLGVKPGPTGRSGMPATRDWLALEHWHGNEVDVRERPAAIGPADPRPESS
jgi:cyclopropane-fatty-acyl-phospholipid synthase